MAVQGAVEYYRYSMCWPPWSGWAQGQALLSALPTGCSQLRCTLWAPDCAHPGVYTERAWWTQLVLLLLPNPETQRYFLLLLFLMPQPPHGYVYA